MGSKPYYADMKVFHHLSNANLLDPSIGTDPVIKRFFDAISALSGVSDYLRSRPTPINIGTQPMLEPNIVGSRFVGLAQKQS